MIFYKRSRSRQNWYIFILINHVKYNNYCRLRLPGSSSGKYCSKHSGTEVFQDRSLFSIFFFLQYMTYSTFSKIFSAPWNSKFRISLHLAGSKTGYTGCHRRKGPNFGRVFLMLNYTDITQNTYIQSWTVTEIMAREKCRHLAFPRNVRLHL